MVSFARFSKSVLHPVPDEKGIRLVFHILHVCPAAQPEAHVPVAIETALIIARDIMGDSERSRALLVTEFAHVMLVRLNNPPVLFPLVLLCHLPLYDVYPRAKGG
jgi:hypothetical protein